MAAPTQHRYSSADQDKIPIYVRVVPYDQWFRLTVPRKATVADLKDIVLIKAGIEHNDPSFLLAHGGGIAPGPRKSDFKSIIDAAASAQLDLEAKSPSSALQRYHSSLGSTEAVQSQGHLTPAILPTSIPKTYMARAPNPLSALGRTTRAGSLPLAGLGVNVTAPQPSPAMPGSSDLVKSVTVAGTPTRTIAHKFGTSSGSDSGSSFGPRGVHAMTTDTDSHPTSKRPSLTPSMSSPHVGVTEVRSTSALSSSSSSSRPVPPSSHADTGEYAGSSRAPASTFLARLTHHKQVRSRASMSSLHQVLNSHIIDRDPLQRHPPVSEGRASPTNTTSDIQRARSSSPKTAVRHTVTASQDTDHGLDAYWLDYEDILARAQHMGDQDPCSSPSSNGSEFARLLSGNEDAKKKEQEALKALQRSQERMRQAASSTGIAPSASRHVSPSTSDGSLGNQASPAVASDIAGAATNSHSHSHSQVTGTTTTSISPLASSSSPWSSAASLDADAIPPNVSPTSPLTSNDAPAPSASLAIPGARQHVKPIIRPASSVQDEDAASSSSQLDGSYTDDVIAAAITPLSGSSPPSPVRLRTTSESNLWGTQLEEDLAKRGIITDDQDVVKRKAAAERTRSGTITGNRRPVTSSSVVSQDSVDGPHAASSSSSAPANDLLGIDRSMALARSTIDEHEPDFKPVPVSSSLPARVHTSSRGAHVASEPISHKRSISSMVRLAGINTNEMAQFRPSHHPLSAHYVMMSFSGGYVLEEFSTLAGLKMRPYELLEVQLADAEDRVRLPRLQELHFNGPSGIERKMWDSSYLEPYAHGWMYVFRPRMASANATRVGLGTWKLRWFMLQGRTLSMYRRRPSRAVFAAAAAHTSYLRPNASKREAEKRKEHHSQLLVLTWSMDQVRWVGSERADTVGSGVHAPSAPPSVSTAPPFLSQDVLTVGFSRPPDAAGYGQSLPAGGGAAAYDAGHTISLRCLTEHQTVAWYKCFQRAQYRSSVESLDGQVESKDLDAQRGSNASRRPSTLETPHRVPVSVDLWRQRALSRSLLAGRGGIVTPGKVGRMGGRNSLVRSRVRPRNTNKEWDDADQWSDDSQEEDFLNVAAE